MCRGGSHLEGLFRHYQEVSKLRGRPPLPRLQMSTSKGSHRQSKGNCENCPENLQQSCHCQPHPTTSCPTNHLDENSPLHMDMIFAMYKKLANRDHLKVPSTEYARGTTHQKSTLAKNWIASRYSTSQNSTTRN